MAWQTALLLIFGILLFLMATGMPVAFAFMLTCAIGAFLFWGGFQGLDLLAMSYFSSVALFFFLPLPLFILMGSITFVSGVGMEMVSTIDKLLGRLPGRLSLVAVGAGILLGTVIGVSGATIGILGKVLAPEMLKRGYHKSMLMGPIVGSGTLAVLIPPSAAVITMGAIGKIDIAKLLVAIIMPGLLLATLFALYIIIRCMLNPSLAPVYEIPRVPLSEKLNSIVRYVLPVSIVIFAVIGVVFLGIATPTEAGAFGVIACYILTALHGKFNLQMVKESAIEAAEVSVMILMILVSAISFSRILATSGAVAGLVNLATSLPVAPMAVIILTQIVIMFLGCFLDPGSIVMITVPMFVPIAIALGYDPVWYGLVMVLNVQLSLITPPLGLDVYVMKAIAPSDISLVDVFKAAIPFCGLGFLSMAMVMVWPQIALWLPNLLSKPIT